MRIKLGFLIIIFAFVMLLFGCDSDSNENVETVDGDQTDMNKSYNVLFDFNVDAQGMSFTDNEYVDYLEEKTGVRIELESPGTSGYMDKLNVMMASGEYPDAFMVTSANRNKILQFADDDLLMDLKPYLDDYPNFKNIPDEAWLPVTGSNGEIWGIPYHRHDAFNQVIYINKTWLDELDMEIPTTIEEFYDVLYAFTHEDPDGNGMDDTFGIVGNNDLSYGGRMFKAMFNAETYKVVDGEVLPPEVTDEYKEYLKFMNRLAQNNILDPEWSTTNSSVFREKINTLEYGAFNGFWHFQTGREFSPGTFDHFIAINPPVGPDGEETIFNYDSVNRHYMGITNSVENVEGLLEFYDWVLSPEGTEYVYLGLEDHHYKKTDQGIEQIEEPQPLHWSFSMIKHGQLNDDVRSILESMHSEDILENLYLATDTGVLDEIATALPYNPDLGVYNLDAIVEEYAANAIMGSGDIDETWDDYIKRYRSSGGDEAIEFWTEWYNSN